MRLAESTTPSRQASLLTSLLPWETLTRCLAAFRRRGSRAKGPRIRLELVVEGFVASRSSRLMAMLRLTAMFCHRCGTVSRSTSAMFEAKVSSQCRVAVGGRRPVCTLFACAA